MTINYLTELLPELRKIMQQDLAPVPMQQTHDEHSVTNSHVVPNKRELTAHVNSRGLNFCYLRVAL